MDIGIVAWLLDEVLLNGLGMENDRHWTHNERNYLLPQPLQSNLEHIEYHLMVA